MAFTLDNFVRSTLQADITAGATTVTVTKAAPPLRDPPDATPTAPGLLVLQDVPTSPTKIEVISYTGRSIVGTVVTLTGVTRGLEGSTASPWSAGTPTFQGITAGVITQKLDASGTAAKATQLETARTIALGGLLGGSASFDGSGNVTITATMADGALSIAKTAGLQGALDGKLGSTATAVDASKFGGQAPSAYATAAQGAKADVALPATRGASNSGNTTFKSGIWQINGSPGNAAPVDGEWFTGFSFGPDPESAAWMAQLWWGWNLNEWYVRGYTQGGGVTAFSKLWHSGNFNPAVQTQANTQYTGVLRVDGGFQRLWANSGGLSNQPRVFVQSGDPGVAAGDGDLWFW